MPTMKEVSTIIHDAITENVNYENQYNDPFFNEIRDLCYDAESHFAKGRNKTANEILGIAVIRINQLRNSMINVPEEN